MKAKAADEAAISQSKAEAEAEAEAKKARALSDEECARLISEGRKHLKEASELIFKGAIDV